MRPRNPAVFGAFVVIATSAASLLVGTQGFADPSPSSTISATASTQPSGGGATGGSQGGDGGDDGLVSACEFVAENGPPPGMTPEEVENFQAACGGSNCTFVAENGPPAGMTPEELENFAAVCEALGFPVVTVDDLVPGVLDEATSGIPLPSPDISPAGTEEIPGIVNVGLWIGVEEVEPVVARAEAGSVWAQAEASLTGITVDMGNGDVVECEGVGDPIGDSAAERDTEEPSPICGYNFDQPSTPEHTGDGNAYHMSATAHWQVRVTGSDGRDVLADPVDVLHEFDYIVAEVQTIGHG